MDPATGVGTIAATLTNPTTLDFRSLAFSPAGLLYGGNHFNNSLYTIDVASGAATLVGATGLTNLEGMDFTSAGQLYAWNSTSSAIRQAGLNQIDPATGDATNVAPLDTGAQQSIFSIATGTPRSSPSAAPCSTRSTASAGP